jgi:hypothetical protein
MIVISAPLHWVEAQDRLCKGQEEIQKGATESLPHEIQPHNPPEHDTMTQRNTPVIYFQEKKPAESPQQQYTRENTASSRAYDKKHMSKAIKERPGPAPNRAASRRRVARTLNAERR